MQALSDPITDFFSSQPPCANAKCAGVGCQNKDIKAWRKSKHTKDPITDECLSMCLPCYAAEVRIYPPSIHSTIFTASDPSLPLAAGTGRGRMRFVRQMRPEPVEALQDPREGGWDTRSDLPVPLLHQGGQGDQEGGTGGLIPLFPPDPTAARRPTTTRTPHRSPATFTPPRHATFTTTRLTITFIHPFCT